MDNSKKFGIAALSAIALLTPWYPKSCEYHERPVSHVQHNTWINGKDTTRNVTFSLEDDGKYYGASFDWTKKKGYEKFQNLENGDTVIYGRLFFISPAALAYGKITGRNDLGEQPFGWFDWEGYTLEKRDASLFYK